MKLLPVLAGVLAVGAALTGCSAPSTPEPTQPSNIITGDTALLNFVDVAHRSCDKASTEGVVETDGDTTSVLFTQADAYDGYSAININNGKATLVFEREVLSCGYNDLFALANEAGTDITTLGVTVTIDGDVYEVTDQQSGPVVYTVKDGVIANVSTRTPGEGFNLDVAYGDTAAYLDDLKAAVITFTKE